MNKKAILATLVVVLGLGIYGYTQFQEEDVKEEDNVSNTTDENPTEDTNVSENPDPTDIPFTQEMMFQKTPTPSTTSDTVLQVEADANTSQILYLWEEGNMPTVTQYTENTNSYFDEPDFRPYLTIFPVPEGTPVKGAVLLCAGGAFSFRGNYTDTIPVAERLQDLGFQCFVVDYRLRPYTQQEGALDLARAVRFVRQNANIYGMDEQDIAVMGFSAGGIQAGELLINFDGLTNGTALDSSYQPDTLDNISADASAAGMVYSFYGRLSVASKDVTQLANAGLPPTYFSYGTEDPFVDEFEANIEALRQAGVEVEDDVLQSTPHGYGPNGNWIPKYTDWLVTIFENN